MAQKVLVPPMKSQGIKTKLVPWIESLVPEDFSGRWVEPFMGTGVVAFNIAPKKALMCDTNPHMINFYSAIQSGEITPDIARRFLEKEGAILLEKGDEHYYSIRERFNEKHAPLDFLFINRAGFNGMIRFNRKGGFNIPFCKKPNRFAKAYVTKIVNQISTVSQILEAKDFDFKCQSFEETINEAKAGDIIYCDPPYIDRHVDYFNSWDEEHEIGLFDSLSESSCDFILSTWHHNDYRKNEYIESHWSKFNILTREHFYHVGGSEKNRNPMIEAIVTTIDTKEYKYKEPETQEQLTLLEPTLHYGSA
ncbi:Dam family site-specific DNA-(adenine-N6)-methyltransferase [Alcanivorax sp.]|uniref:DNA adenine methylase n=1 Tax=Alcanivorax sp. TaxID=1872427 RepID=UPI0025C1194E|nr:Dam family site-specific DNA-(adenine-N6)-methyltransferase [Alcanivorax sp.]